MNEILLIIIQSVIVSILVVLIFWVLLRFSIKENNRIRKILFAHLGINDYINNISKIYYRLTQQKEKIQKSLKDSITKDYDETNKNIDKLYKEMDETIIDLVKEISKFEKGISEK